MNIYDEVQKHAESQGLTVWQLCDRAKVPFHTVLRWKQAEPKTIELFNTLINYKNDE